MKQAKPNTEGNTDGVTVKVHHTAQVTIAEANTLPAFELNGVKYAASASTGVLAFPTTYKYINMTTGARGSVTSDDALEAAVDDSVRIFWEEEKNGSTGNEAVALIISPETFPGTYRVIGDTKIRSEKTGHDELFQFVIEKAKLLSEVTLTMQADGDPSTFSMTLNVLRDKDGNMFSLIKY